MKKILLTFLSLLIGISTIYADTLKKEWEKTWGGNDDSYFEKIFEYINDNYYVFGRTQADNIIDINKYAILDYDKLGNLTYQIGTTSNIYDYNYYTLGSSIIGLDTSSKIIFKVDSQFRLDKQVTYGNEKYALVQCKIVNNKFYVQEITDDNKTIVKIYDENLNEEVINSDDYYILVDLTSFDKENYIASVIKKEANGYTLHLMKYNNKNIVWDKEIKKLTEDEIKYESIFLSSEMHGIISKLYIKNNYIYSYSVTENDNKYVSTISKYDKDGNLIKEIVPNNIDELQNSIIIKYFVDKSDNITAYILTYVDNKPKTYVVKYDESGKEFWKTNTLLYDTELNEGTTLDMNAFSNNMFELGNDNILININDSVNYIATVNPIIINSKGEIIWKYEGNYLIKTAISSKDKDKIILVGMTKKQRIRGKIDDASQPENDIPEGVVIKYSISYNVNIEEEGKGVVDVDIKNAKNGDIVKIDAKPDKGYRVGEIIVTDSNGNVIDVKDNKFIMPSSVVTVKVIFTNTPVENPKTGFLDLTVILVVAILLSTIVYKYIKNNLLVKNL